MEGKRAVAPMLRIADRREGRPAGRVSRRFQERSLPLAAMVIALLAWEGLVRWQRYPSFILPSPGRVWARFLSIARDGTLWWHTQITLWEVAIGLVLGLGVAMLLGYGLAKSPTLERILSPYIVASQAIPAVAIAPLLIIWFGFGGLSKILTCALTVFFPALVNTVVGLRSVEEELVMLMRSLGASRWQRFTLLEIPAALPVLLGGLKVGVTLAVIGAVVGEFVGADRGLGFLINLSRGIFDTPLLFVALFTLVTIALILYGAASWLESHLLVWRG